MWTIPPKSEILEKSVSWICSLPISLCYLSVRESRAHGNRRFSHHVSSPEFTAHAEQAVNCFLGQCTSQPREVIKSSQCSWFYSFSVLVSSFIPPFSICHPKKKPHLNLSDHFKTDNGFMAAASSASLRATGLGNGQKGEKKFSLLPSKEHLILMIVHKVPLLGWL